MAEQCIFRDYVKGRSPSRMRIFISAKGKPIKIHYQLLSSEDFDAAAKRYSIGEIRNDEISWEEMCENDWKNVFKNLALGNPQDFKTLYYDLKESNEELFAIIKSTLEEIQSIFNFE